MDLMSNSTVVKTENSFLPPFYSSYLDWFMAKIKWNLFWLMQEVCWIRNFWLCFQLSDCLVSSNFLKVWKVRLKWIDNLPLSIFSWHIQWVLIDNGYKDALICMESQKDNFYLPDRVHLELNMKNGIIFTQRSYFCWIFCCIQNIDQKILIKGWHTLFFFVLNSLEMYITLSSGFKICALIFFLMIWWFKIICS